MPLKLRKVLFVVLVSLTFFCSCANTIPKNEIKEPPSIKEEAPYQINTSNIKDLQEKYVTPILVCGDIKTYNWSSAQEIQADDLIEFCAYQNLLNLPTEEDRAIRYSGKYVNNIAPAEEVEAAILKHFDVSREHIRTSKYYNEDSNTYSLIYRITGTLVLNNVEKEGETFVFHLFNSPDPKIVGKLKVNFLSDGTIKYQSLELDEYELLNQKYLFPILSTNLLTLKNWESPDEINPDIFYIFFLAFNYGNEYEMLGTGNDEYHPADLVENYVKQYFDVSSDHMRKATHYNPEKNGYSNGGLGGISSIRVTDASLDSDILTLNYDVIVFENQTLISGEVKIKVLEGGFKYLSCDFQRFEVNPPPVTGESY